LKHDCIHCQGDNNVEIHEEESAKLDKQAHFFALEMLNTSLFLKIHPFFKAYLSTLAKIVVRICKQKKITI